MLGLDAEGGAVSEGDVKRAFREAALRWHPDRQKVGMVHCSGDPVYSTVLFVLSGACSTSRCQMWAEVKFVKVFPSPVGSLCHVPW